MAYANTTAAHLGLSDRVHAFVSDIRAKLAQRAAYEQTYKELSSLTDRELADIGLARRDIAEVAAASTAK